MEKDKSKYKEKPISSTDVPVVLVIFRRPDTTRRVFEAIREARPKQLFIVADGPRPDIQGEEEKCRAARDVVADIDWDCEVCRCYADENMGCKQRVSSGLDWVFDQVNEAIILEDDCVPHATFFPYCSELLDRYRDDERVMVVSGNNFQPPGRDYGGSYYFSAYNHCWGWATWRRSWEHYDGNFEAWQDLRETEWLHGWLASESAAHYWGSIFDLAVRGEIDSWAYPWTFSCWVQHGLSVLPSVNLVSNIGIGPEATHTKNHSGIVDSQPAYPISIPMEHQGRIIRDYAADEYTTRNHFGVKTGLDRLAHRYTPDAVKQIVRAVIGNLKKYQ